MPREQCLCGALDGQAGCEVRAVHKSPVHPFPAERAVQVQSPGGLRAPGRPHRDVKPWSLMVSVKVTQCSSTCHGDIKACASSSAHSVSTERADTRPLSTALSAGAQEH